MRCLYCALLGMFLLTIGGAHAGGKKDDDKKFGALPPHGLDSAFGRGNTERALTNGLLNNKLFERAVKAALKAKREQEERFRKNPKLADATPAQAARLRFLEVLKEGNGKDEKPRKE
ncbi:MAG: hypothetical protein L0Y72_05720 [Gemmataceae bacterium]|nr:hypothetical protein [Gemmataceae bacterium]MCI0738522.1 hypothetical protein [Gemmataceae bacterium]